MAKRESLATLKKQLAATQQKLKAAHTPYRSALANMFNKCAPPIIAVGRSRTECQRIMDELLQAPMFNEMIECCDPETVGYVITDAVRVGMEVGKRLQEAQRLEEMVGYGIAEVR
jgi:hypothetical protein